MVRVRAARDEIVEQGDVFFAYRPKVEHDEAEGLGDVQRFFMVLKPEGGGPIRLTVLGRKRLPDVETHERLWGFVDMIAKSGEEIEAEFKEQHYRTKTRGDRTLPAARPAGEGVYALLRRGRNLHLVYELELPEQPGEVQRELNIPQQGAYVLAIINPERPPPPRPGIPEHEDPHYPKPLQQEFRGRRFAADDPHLLDFADAEFVLVGARTDPERAYDIDIEAERETAGKADIFRQLKLSRRDHPLEPLFEGKWR